MSWVGKKETGPREASRGPLLSLVLTREQLRHLLLVVTTAAERQLLLITPNSSKRHVQREHMPGAHPEDPCSS